MLSPKDPTRESERLLGQFRLKAGILAIVFGCAHVYLLKKLKERQAKYGGLILVVEADTIFAGWVKKKFPQLFNGLPVFTPETDFLIPEFLENIYIENLLGYRFFKNTASIRLDKNYYLDIESSIKKTLSSQFSDLFTRLEFEPTWIINSISQIAWFSRARSIKTLFGQGENQTAILVSTGPSLRQRLDLIKKNQERFFVACVDSAYRVLTHSGITPHLIMTLDSQSFTLRHFLGLPLGKENQFPMLCADLVANPKVIRIWKGPLFFSITAQYSGSNRKTTPGSDFVEQEVCQANNEPGYGLGDIQSGGSVATSLFDLLRQMSFRSIILVGQDLAFSHREIHCTGTHHTDIWASKGIHRLESLENISEKILKRRHTVYEDSIQGKKIKADYVFSLYRNWFEEAIAKMSIKIYNATKEGLKIRSALPYEAGMTFDGLSSPPLFRKLLMADKPFILAKNKCLNILNKFLEENYSPDLREKYRFIERIGRWYEIQKQRNEMTRSSNLIKTMKKSEAQVEIKYDHLRIKKQERFWEKLQRVAARSKRLISDSQKKL